MMDKKYSTIMALVCMSVIGIVMSGPVLAQKLTRSAPWVADQEDGTYKNPVLYSDYSDLDAIRVGEDYYMTASSFNCMPGLPILHSKDLVNWKVVNYALKRQEPAEVYDIPQHGKGVWAPAIRYHNHEFYIYYPDPDYGIYMIKAKSALGEWTKPILVLPGKGIIDPCPFWDTDGQAYLGVAWAGSRAGVNSLLTIFKLSVDGQKVIDEGKHVFDGHGANHTVEGPKIYKRGKYYYIFAPAGGVATGWQLVIRSKNIYGPYEHKVVMDQGETAVNGPHQGALLDTKAGESWFLHFQDKGAYGRVVHLQPVQWKNDWPVIGNDKDGDGKGEPVSTYKKPNTGMIYPVVTPALSDEFNTDTLGLQWQWHANPKIQWSALLKGGNALRLFAYPQDKSAVNLWRTPNLLLQKFPAPAFTTITKITLHTEWDVWQGKRAGLLIIGNDYASISISKDEKGYKVSQIVCKNASEGTAEKLIEQKDINSATIYLKVTVSAPDATCRFSYSEDGQIFTDLGDLFTAKPGKWIGAKVGLFCKSEASVSNGGYADVDWFRVSK